MKYREFSTQKGDFVLVDRPKHIEVTITIDETFSIDRESLPYKAKRIGDLKTITDEQAAEIMCEIKATMETENKPVTLYEHKNSRNAYLSASICLIDYLKTLGIHLYENPVLSKFAIGRHKEWEEAEASTFYNPIILKRI